MKHVLLALTLIGASSFAAAAGKDSAAKNRLPSSMDGEREIECVSAGVKQTVKLLVVGKNNKDKVTYTSSDVTGSLAKYENVQLVYAEKTIFVTTPKSQIFIINDESKTAILISMKNGAIKDVVADFTCTSDSGAH